MHNSKNKKIAIILFFLLNLLNLSLSRAQSPSIAIMLIQSTAISQNEATTLTNRLNTELVQVGKYTVVEQSKVSELFKQKGFIKADECATTECFLAVGKILGVQYIVSASVGLIGETYTLDVYRIAVPSGETVQTICHDFEGRIDDVLVLLKQVAMEISGIKPDKNYFDDLRKRTSHRKANNRYSYKARYHVGASFFYGLTRHDDYIPIGLRFLYHKNRYTIGASLGRVVDYGYDFIDTDEENVNLYFHKMTFAEISFDYHLTTNKPVSAFAGMAIAYSNPMRSEWSRSSEPPWDSIYDNERKNKIGIHPQIGCYLRRDYPISSRIALGFVLFPSEKEGLNNSAFTFEITLLLNF